MDSVKRKPNPSQSEYSSISLGKLDGFLLLLGWLSLLAGAFLVFGVGITLMVLGACTMALGVLL